MPEKRFKIAFSFAGEKRAFVAEVAGILAGVFGEEKILYDKYHEAEFAGYDLGITLPELYRDDSELVVVVLCPGYESKQWTGWEWVQIYSLLNTLDGRRVMLSRFEYADVRGLSRTAAFVELDAKAPIEFAIRILERLALNEGKPKNCYAHQLTKPVAYTQPRTSIKHNLPTLQPFFGRQDELKIIAEALEPENRTWGALIDGPGGMGKTSLAVYAAYHVSPEVFNRIIFVSLKNRELDDDGERDLSGFIITGLQELFGELAQELEHSDISKAIEKERPKLLLGALKGTRCLLVLDNLESLTKSERDMLFTFVKRLPEGCKAILTSRGRIGSGAEELILEKLDETAALATLAELATHNKALENSSEEERLQLYKTTSGKPLLLRWTAGQLGRGQCITIADAIVHLKSCPKGNDPLDFIFGDLVQDFSEIETIAICALTYFNLPAKAQHIANVAEHNVNEIEKALRSLVNRSLVVPNKELETFALVPLVADYLYKHKPEVLAETGSRLEKYVYALVTENGGEYNHDGFLLLNTAWPAIAAALPAFLNGDNNRLQSICNMLFRFLDFAGKWDEGLFLYLEAEKIAEANGDERQAGWRAFHAGWIYMLRKQTNEAIDSANRAEEYWIKKGIQDEEKGAAIRLRGLGYKIAGNYSVAIETFNQAIDLYRANPISRNSAATLNSLAEAEMKSGDFNSAERDYTEVLRIATILQDEEMIAGCTGNLSTLALRKQEWQKGEILAREALPLSEKVGRQQLIAVDCSRIAEALVMQGRKEEGLLYAKRAVGIYATLGSPDIKYAISVLRLCEE